MASAAESWEETCVDKLESGDGWHRVLFSGLKSTGVGPEAAQQEKALRGLLSDRLGATPALVKVTAGGKCVVDFRCAYSCEAALQYTWSVPEMTVPGAALVVEAVLSPDLDTVDRELTTVRKEKHIAAAKERYQEAAVIKRREEALATHRAELIAKGAGPPPLERTKSKEEEEERRRKLLALKQDNVTYERQLRLKEARVNELARELEKAREQQRRVGQALDTANELSIEERKQRELRDMEQSIDDAEGQIIAELQAEESRTRDTAQQPGVHLPMEQRTGDGATEAEMPLTLDQLPEVTTPSLRLKNTFYEYQIPMVALVRTKTTPSFWAPTEEGVDEAVGDRPEEEGARDEETAAAPAGTGPPTEAPTASPSAAPAAPSLAAEDAAQPRERPLFRRQVLLKNVPALPTQTLERELRQELSRIWQVALGRKAPGVVTVDTREVVAKPGADTRTWAEMAKDEVGGTEAVVTFKDLADATWLVEGRSPASYSKPETLSLRGRIVTAEWAGQAPVDWRRTKVEADEDASSGITYRTQGTKQSFAPNDTKRNRAVILDGVPKKWQMGKVQSEVISLLKRLWQQHGLTFDATEMLHASESDCGIQVRASPGMLAGNGGSCVVRFKVHDDASWLVRSAWCMDFTVEGGVRLRTFWARPREQS